MGTALRIIGLVSTLLVVAVIGLGVYLWAQHGPTIRATYEEIRDIPAEISEQRERLPDSDDARDVIDRARDLLPGG